MRNLHTVFLSSTVLGSGLLLMSIHEQSRDRTISRCRRVTLLEASHDNQVQRELRVPMRAVYCISCRVQQTTHSALSPRHPHSQINTAPVSLLSSHDRHCMDIFKSTFSYLEQFYIYSCLPHLSHAPKCSEVFEDLFEFYMSKSATSSAWH